jgi:hypothetical protein
MTGEMDQAAVNRFEDALFIHAGAVTRVVWRGRWCERSMPAIRKTCGRARTRQCGYRP